MCKFTEGVEPTGAGEFDFMSTDPNSGIAFIEMFDSTNGTMTNGEQFSGVLISPDEILTVAHGVTNTDGTLRNYGTAYFGYDGGALTGGDVITSVHVVDGSHPSGSMESDQKIESDYAVIHLATPVTGAQVFALGTGASGTYTIAGYPAVDGGKLTSLTEALTVDDSILTGGSLVPNGTAMGASGGAVYTVDNGTPTVRGLDVAEDGAGHAFMMGLSQSQIDQIKAWVSSDDAGQTWASGGSGTTPTPVTTSPTPTVTPTPVANSPTHVVVTPTPIDHLRQLAAQLDSSAAYTYGPRSQVIAAVATSLTQARHEGLSTSNLPELASEAANLLQKKSNSPNRATAYMAGLMASESGVTRNRIFGYIANVFGIELGDTQQMRQLALAGFDEDKLLGSATTGAPITTAATSIYELADTISRSYDGIGHIGYTTSDTTSTHSLVAPHIAHGVA